MKQERKNSLISGLFEVFHGRQSKFLSSYPALFASFLYGLGNNLDIVILRFGLHIFERTDTHPAPGLFAPQFGLAITCLETGFLSECRVFKREIMHGVADAWCLSPRWSSIVWTVAWHFDSQQVFQTCWLFFIALTTFWFATCWWFHCASQTNWCLSFVCSLSQGWLLELVLWNPKPSWLQKFRKQLHYKGWFF